jgi:hypothetical protein
VKKDDRGRDRQKKQEIFDKDERSRMVKCQSQKPKNFVVKAQNKAEGYGGKEQKAVLVWGKFH